MPEWFKSWFDSPYYHILYKNRNDAEAKILLDNIIRLLHPAPKSKMLDQACGKGRHARYLNKLGFHVTGIDLSEKSIRYCRQFKNDILQFHVYDMRAIFKENYFDYVFNIFTSLGYFSSDDEQQLAVDCAAAALKPGGKYIIDFMNAKKTVRELVSSETINREGITFHIERRFEKDFIKKKISFSDKEKEFTFEENVEAMLLNDFERYFKHAGLTIENTFGDYHLSPFDVNTSERLILIAGK